MGRPPKLKGERKGVDLRIPVTDDQKALITNAASRLGMDMAGWARPLLIHAAQAVIGESMGKK